MKPRVFSVIPSLGTGHGTAWLSHCTIPTAGKVDIIPGQSASSLLAYGFNSLWAAALDWARAGVIDYFLMHHSDIQIVTPCWLDVMLEEIKREEAAVLSAVVPIKDGSGLTSTAVETGDVWNPRKLTLRQCRELPTTFSFKDLPNPGPALLVNTGLILVNLHREQFHKTNADGVYDIFFTIGDRVVRGKDGSSKAQVNPEDWEFSRRCHAAGLRVFATRAVRLTHHGNNEWPNWLPEEKVA